MRKNSKILGALAAVVAVSLCGCSASESALNAGTNGAAGGYHGTDIGGIGSSSLAGGSDGGLFGRVTEAFGAKTTAEGAAFDMADAAAGSYAAPGAAMNGDFPEVDFPVSDDPVIEPQSGLLTGGEWNDNDHWEDWKALYEKRDDWNGYQDTWRITALKRVEVKVQGDNGEPLEGAKVSVNGQMDAVTDNTGTAYLFLEDHPGNINVSGVGEIGVDKSYSWSSLEEWHDMTETFTIPGGVSKTDKKLDLMIMCDTTGSMSDELEYLKAELKDIVKDIKEQNANIPTRISVNFYRDEGDEYEVREFPFSENIDDVVDAIGEQSAAGGGDFPEAVHSALKSAVDDHDWDENSVKIMFLVLDAPPHDDVQIVDTVNKYMMKAAAEGIRIVPVASSGIDKSTEYLLRVMAQVTGGTYTFLTNDSGVGGDHLEPTVGAFNVEKLKDLMVRIVNGYLE